MSREDALGPARSPTESDRTAAVTAALEQALASTGRRLGDLELLRAGSNLVFRSIDGRLVARMSTSTTRSEVARQLSAAVRLGAAGAPLLLPIETTVLMVSGRPVTLWPLAQSTDVGPSELGSLLRRLHTIPPPPDLPAWSWRPRVEARLQHATQEGVPADLIEFMEAEAEQLAARTPTDPTDPVTIHGDAHVSNVVRFGSRLVLIDLDDLAVGPWEVDVAPFRVAVDRFGRSEREWEELLASVGRPADHPFDWFVRVRQLTMTSWLSTLWGLRPESRRELRHRVETWSGNEAWSPL